MDNLIIYEAENLLRDASPMQVFLSQLNQIFVEIRIWLINPTRGIIPRLYQADPLILLPIGFIAMTATVGILKRMLSRD